MKKFIIAALMAVAFTGVIFAQESETSTRAKVEALMQEDLFANESAITELSGNLSLSDKQALYEQYSRSYKGYSAMNFWIGYGVGSFVQGNKKAGFTQLTWELVGTGLAAVGSGIVSGSSAMAAANLSSTSSGSYSSSSTNNIVTYVGLGVCVSGAIMAFAARCYGSGIVKSYSINRNSTLLRELNLTSAEISLVPVIDPVSNNYGFTGTIRL